MLPKKKASPKIAFAKLVDAEIDKYKGKLPKVIVVEEAVLLASAKEESGLYSITDKVLRRSIKRYLENNFVDRDLTLVNSASYACQVIANHCFVKNYDENSDVEIQVDWVLNDLTGEFSAIVKKSRGDA